MTFGGKDNRGPSIAELQKYIRDKVDMVFLLNTGENVIGKLRWFDENAFSVAQDGQQPFTILRSAVVGYRKHNGQATTGAKTEKAAVASNAQASAAEQADQTGERTAEDTGA